MKKEKRTTHKRLSIFASNWVFSVFRGTTQVVNVRLLPQTTGFSSFSPMEKLLMYCYLFRFVCFMLLYGVALWPFVFFPFSKKKKTSVHLRWTNSAILWLLSFVRLPIYFIFICSLHFHFINFLVSSYSLDATWENGWSNDSRWTCIELVLFPPSSPSLPPLSVPLFSASHKARINYCMFIRFELDKMR